MDFNMRVLKVYQCGNRFHIASNLQKPTICQVLVGFKKDIHNYMKRLFLKNLAFYQLHICVRMDFLHILHLKQHITIPNRHPAVFQKSLSSIKLDIERDLQKYKTVLFSSTVIFTLKSMFYILTCNELIIIFNE